MLKAVSFEVLLIWLLLLTCVFAAERCNCDDESSLWTIDAIVESQRVGDFLIAVAYFSIPIELLFFVSCSSVPFKWVLFQFIAFIVLCGMTHLLNGWTYGPHTFQLMVAVTVFKILTALVSCATSITLLTLIPMLLKVKVRELMLKKKTFDLGREFGIIMRQKEATTHVRMLTQEIRKSLDKHKILYTTLVELSEALGLQNCAVWMPNIEKTEVILTHELNGRNGPVAAIRMPMLRFCNFKGGTPELRQTCYAILVLILPCNDLRSWSFQELEIIKVVADQVAVALSHAAIIEESQLMRDKLLEQNLALQAEKTNAMMASQARAKFQKVMSDGMRRPMHSILMLLSMLQTCLAKFMSVYRSFGFVADVDKSLPDNVVGDEKRVFQVILHMIGNAINGNHGGGVLVFRVFAETGNQGRDDQGWNTWRPSSSSGDVNIRFEIGINAGDPESVSSVPLGQFVGAKPSGDWIGGRLNFNICKRIIQLMQGNIWLVPNAQGFPQVMALFLRFQLRQSFAVAISEPGENSEPSNSNSFFRGLQVLLVDNIDIHRAVTQRLLHKLGCVVTTVSSGYECLNVIGHGGSSFQVILLDLHMPELDGFEVATRIRKFGSRNWPMILGLTSSSIEDLKERCVQIGINGLIRKPVLLHGIASELRRILMQGDGVM
uniref:Ethylene receptor 2 n=1 Tax=Cajanus cajan TaxID=3821 RepID=A0A151SP45_CAJCA|nr:Ethylene receptor 2 [Cajanus cajan]